MNSPTVSNFVKQQGYPDVPERSSNLHFRALSFQPTVTAPVVLVAILLQAAPAFLALSGILWWSALAPRWNPFDAIHNRFLARPRGLPRLERAPAPRRFSMGMAASFMFGIGSALLAGHATIAFVLEGFLALALTAVVFGRFCLGSYIFHLLRGKVAFANRTLPWARA